MKRISKIVLGTVLVVSAVGTFRIFAGENAGCHFGPHGGPFSSGIMAGRIAERISTELDLTAVQKGNLDALIDEVVSIRQQAMATREQRKDELLALLKAPVLDQSKVLSLVSEKAASVEARAPEVISAIAGFTDSLTVEQKAELEDRIKRGFGHGMRPF